VSGDRFVAGGCSDGDLNFVGIAPAAMGRFDELAEIFFVFGEFDANAAALARQSGGEIAEPAADGREVHERQGAANAGGGVLGAGENFPARD